jgi:hypothetical protein
MPIPELLTETMIEGTTGLYTFVLVDELGAGIESTFLDSLSLTLYDTDSHTVINARQDQDILNANDGTVETDPGPPITTTVTFHLQPADTIILNQNRRVEYRVLSFRWTWNSGQRVGRHAVQFGVENAEFVS